MRLRWWGLCAACACTWSSSVLADSAQGKRPSPIAAEPGQLMDARAAATFREGIAAFDRQDFEAARVAFLQTYALKPEAVVVRRNLGLAEIYSGYYLDGARRLARVLHTTAEGNAEDRARMLQSLKLAEAHLERISVEVAQQGAQIHIDGVALGSSPLPILWYVLPGPYRVRVDKPGFVGYAESRLARAGAAQHLRVVLQRVVKEPAPVPAPPPLPRVQLPPVEVGPNPWLLLTGSALTAGALAAGAVFSINAASSKDKAALLRADLRSFSCNTPDVIGCDELMDVTHRHDRQVRVAFASFIGAGVTGAATLLYGLLAGGGEGPAAAQGEESAKRTGWELHAAWRRGPYAAWTAEF
ncbi:MAG: hypothetical protein RL685_6191 [Pseudomonadota bacterium]|jgi:hypothetical protein